MQLDCALGLQKEVVGNRQRTPTHEQPAKFRRTTQAWSLTHFSHSPREFALHSSVCLPRRFVVGPRRRFFVDEAAEVLGLALVLDHCCPLLRALVPGHAPERAAPTMVTHGALPSLTTIDLPRRRIVGVRCCR